MNKKYCLMCEEEEATLPSENPVFCSPTCAGNFAMERWSWCGEHSCWFQPDFGCEECAKQERIKNLKKRQKDIEIEIKRLEEKPPEKLMKG